MPGLFAAQVRIRLDQIEGDSTGVSFSRHFMFQLEIRSPPELDMRGSETRDEWILRSEHVDSSCAENKSGRYHLPRLPMGVPMEETEVGLLSTCLLVSQPAPP